MAKRRRKAPKSNPAPRRRRRSSITKRTTRALGRRSRGAVSAMKINEVLKSAPPAMIGMFAAKFASKLGGAGSSETDPSSWNWRSYLQSAAGAMASSFLLGSVKPAWAKKALEGGVYFTLFKLIENELIANNATASQWLGEIPEYVPDEYMQGLEEQEDYVPGNVYPNSVGEPYLLGEDGNWYPLEDTHRLPETTSQYMGDSLTRPGPLGDELVPVTSLGGSDDKFDRAFLEGEDSYSKAFF